MSKINTEILIAVLSLLGTCFGSLIGAFASGKLTVYRIEQLEKKVDKHNNVIERLVLLEHDVNNLGKVNRPIMQNFPEKKNSAEILPDS